MLTLRASGLLNTWRGGAETAGVRSVVDRVFSLIPFSACACLMFCVMCRCDYKHASEFGGLWLLFCSPPFPFSPLSPPLSLDLTRFRTPIHDAMALHDLHLVVKSSFLSGPLCTFVQQWLTAGQNGRKGNPNHKGRGELGQGVDSRTPGLLSESQRCYH